MRFGSIALMNGLSRSRVFCHTWESSNIILLLEGALEMIS